MAKVGSFDRDRHVVFANGEAWIQIDALMDLLIEAKPVAVEQATKQGNVDWGLGAGAMCDEIRMQLMKLTVLLP